MTDLQAALGSAQMDRAEAIIAERRRLADHYNRAFAALDWLQTPAQPDGYQHGYQSYPCLFQPERTRQAVMARDTAAIQAINDARNAWMDRLQHQGISTRPATHAVHMLSFYRQKYGLEPMDFPNAYAANHCSISLPLFHAMSADEQDWVIATVIKAECG
jgi:dTDP-4-amino-4,6-dideoxygalactose transaminase